MADANDHYGLWPHPIADYVGAHGHKEPGCARRPPGFGKVGQAVSGLLEATLHARRG